MPAWPTFRHEQWQHAHESALRISDPWKTPPPGGDEALRELLAGELATRGELAITGGVRQALPYLLAQLDELQIEIPTFADIPVLASSLGCRTSFFDWSNLGAGGGSNTIGIWLTHPCRNPDGRSLGREEQRVVGEQAAKGRPIFINEIYRFYSHAAPSEIEGVWRVGSLSKLFGGGSRLGWVVAPADHTMTDAALSASPATLWQRTWLNFLSEVTIGQIAAEVATAARQARDAFCASAGLEDVSDDQAPFRLIQLHSGFDSDFCDEARRLGVLVSPGKAFLAMPSTVRVAFHGISPEVAGEAGRRLGNLLRVASARFSTSSARPADPNRFGLACHRQRPSACTEAT